MADGITIQTAHMERRELDQRIEDARAALDDLRAKRRQTDSLLKATRQDIPYPEPGAPVSANGILRICAARHGLLVSHLRSPSRARGVVWPRQEAMYQLARLTALSLLAIGRLLGGRNHATILHGIRQHIARTGAPSVRGIGGDHADC